MKQVQPQDIDADIVGCGRFREFGMGCNKDGTM